MIFGLFPWNAILILKQYSNKKIRNDFEYINKIIYIYAYYENKFNDNYIMLR